jgi:amino acid adenylation domain-containing protein
MTSNSSARALLAHLNDLGVKIRSDGEKLRIEAPRGVIDSTLHQELTDRKDEIIGLLSNSHVPRHKDHMPLKGVPRSERLPLSFAQERLWFLHQLEPDSTAYSMPKTIRLRGSLDKEALRRTFSEIGRRHESLRTTFRSLEGRAEQVLAPEPSFSTKVVDLGHLPEAERENEVRRLTEIASRKPFDLQKGPLFRVVLYDLGNENFVLHINMHHMISDYWSLGVLSQEFIAIYTASINGTPAQLPELPVQYADYAYWQRRWLQGDVLEKHLGYWRENLGGTLATLDLPSDRPRPAVQTHTGAVFSLEIQTPLLEDLRRLSRRQGVSLFMVLLAAFKLLLSRYTGQEDIIVGTPIAGRDRVELEGLIGFFINTIVMRTDLSGPPTFRELLGRVRETALGAYAHQAMPFEKLVEELAPERDLSRTPIFQIFFNHIRVDDRRFAIAGLEGEFADAIEPDSKFDMTLYIWEHEQTMWLEALYNADLFDADRIGIMLEQLENLLRQIVQSPDQKIGSYCLVPPSQRQRLPNPTAPLASRQTDCVHHRLSGQAVRYCGKPAIIDALGQWSYKDVEIYSNRIANHLHSKGMAAGDTVAVYGHRCSGLVLALLGILKAGGVFLILDAADPAPRLLKFLEAADPAGWLQLESAGPLKDGLGAYLSEAGMKLRLVLPKLKTELDEVLVGMSETVPDLVISSEDRAYILFTSGSTGVPKGVVGLHGPLSHFIDWHCREFGIGPSDRFSMLSGLAHDPLLRDIFTPLWSGGTLCIPDAQIMLVPNGLRQWMLEQGITAAHMTPALGQVLTKKWKAPLAAGEALSSLRYVFFGGDTLTGAHVEKIRRIAPLVECVNFYGTTETPQAMGYLRIEQKNLAGRETENRFADSVIPLGRGIEGVQLLLLNHGTHMTGIGEVGEVHVRTAHLSAGYLNDAALTGERFFKNPYTHETGDRLYKTGDLGRYRPDGAVEFCGRVDHQVSIRGFRVELKEIEAVLNRHPMISDCVLIAERTEAGDTSLVACVTGDATIDGDSRGLYAYLKDHLPSYMMPSRYIYMDSIPLTQNGKVDVKALQARIEPVTPNQRHRSRHRRHRTTSSAAETKMERILADIWKQTLNIDDVSVKDNFFEIGGHSLLSMEVIAAVEKKTGVLLSPRELVYQTLKQLSASVESKLDSSDEGRSSGDERSIFSRMLKKLPWSNR